MELQLKIESHLEIESQLEIGSRLEMELLRVQGTLLEEKWLARDSESKCVVSGLH